MLRKLIHLGGTVVPLGYLFLLPDRIALATILGLTAVVFLAIDLARIRKLPIVTRLFAALFDRMLVAGELGGRITGATWLLIGAFFTVLIFPREIAIWSLLVVTVGDPLAALIGSCCGRSRVGGKSLEGTLAGILFTFPLVYLIPDLSIGLALIGLVTGMLVELLPLPINDNLAIPLFSGVIMTVLRTILG